ncbi:hypothetical protein K523DRAFT_323982 [Schizophyllum commune Tattone D]|nr:hypothetical protein K523DRAFT_323982 [Schizophyllum commune Tattone D]
MIQYPRQVVLRKSLVWYTANYGDRSVYMRGNLNHAPMACTHFQGLLRGSSDPGVHDPRPDRLLYAR